MKRLLKNSSTLLAILSLLLLTSCAKKKNKSPAPPPPEQPAKTRVCPSLPAWSEKVSDRVIEDTIPIHRIFTKYIETNCSGEPTGKEEWITTKDPKNSYILRARDLDVSDTKIFVEAYNATTCEPGHYKRRDADVPEMTIKMHTSKGVWDRMYINRDLTNMVIYRFSSCLNGTSVNNESCQRVTLETGTIYLDVDYSETYKEEPRYRKKTSCE